MGSPVYTTAWETTRNRFLNRHLSSMQVQAYVKQLVKRIETEPPDTQNGTVAYFSVQTKLPKVAYIFLECVCAVNMLTGDYAPAALYFPGAKQSESIENIVQAIKDVRKELGWQID